VGFVELLNADRDIPDDVKADFVNQVANEMPQWSSKTAELRGEFEVIAAVMRGTDVVEVMGMITEFAGHCDHPYNRSSTRDSLLRTASQAYAARGLFERAAATASHIVRGLYWNRAIERYALEGGDLNLARQAGEMQQLFGDDYKSESPRYPTPNWAEREDTTAFLLHMSEENYEAAGQVLVGMAEKIRQDTNASGNYESFLRYTRRLLDAHPASTALAMPIVNAVSQCRSFGYTQQILNMFSSRGSTEARTAGWTFAAQHNYGRALYLSRYAYAALAAAGVRQ
jgi:hypothetical protein